MGRENGKQGNGDVREEGGLTSVAVSQQENGDGGWIGHIGYLAIWLNGEVKSRE